MSTVHTIHDADGVHVELVDGELTGLRFRADGDVGPDELCRRIAVVVDAAAAENSVARAPVETGTPDPHRDRVMAFVATQLERARDLPTRPRPAWFPGRADGRDATGRVHVSLTATGIVELAVPDDILADPRVAAAAVQEAWNLARERLCRDAREFGERLGEHGRDELADVTWAELAEQLDRRG